MYFPLNFGLELLTLLFFYNVACALHEVSLCDELVV